MVVPKEYDSAYMQNAKCMILEPGFVHNGTQLSLQEWHMKVWRNASDYIPAYSSDAREPHAEKGATRYTAASSGIPGEAGKTGQENPNLSSWDSLTGPKSGILSSWTQDSRQHTLNNLPSLVCLSAKTCKN